MAGRQASTAPPELQRLWEVNNRLTKTRSDLRSTTAALHAEQKASAHARAQLEAKDRHVSELQVALAELQEAREAEAQATAEKLAGLRQEIDSYESKDEVATVRIAELERDLQRERQSTAAAVARADDAAAETTRLVSAHSEKLEALADGTQQAAKRELALHSQLLARDSSNAALAARLLELEEEHALKLQSLRDAHTAADIIGEQNAARLAETQAAMQQSIAAMECASATTAAKHEQELAQLQARVQQAEAQANRFRTAHAQEVEEKSIVAARLQAALAEVDAQLEINKAAWMKERASLMQTHAEELARVETKWRERHATLESAGRAALCDCEAKYAGRVAVLQSEFAAQNAGVESALHTCSGTSLSSASIGAPQAHTIRRCAKETSAIRIEMVAVREMVVNMQAEWMKLLPRVKRRLLKKIQALQEPTAAEPIPVVVYPHSPVSLHAAALLFTSNTD